MSSADLIRWGAIAAVVGAARSVLFAFVGENSRAHVPVDAARYAFLVVGVVGLYLHPRQSRGFGRLGAVGFYVCLFVFALVAILDLGIVFNEGVEQTYIALGPVRGPLLLVGLLLFGAAVLRSERLPRGGAWLLIAAALTNVLGILALIISGGAHGALVFIAPTVLFGLGVVRLRPLVRRRSLQRAAISGWVNFREQPQPGSSRNAPSTRSGE